MTVEIRFEHFENPRNEAYIASILKEFASLYPTWLRTLTVSITDTLPESGSHVWTIGTPEYGTATIIIVSRWLDNDPELQRLDLLHEILHVAHRREYSFVQRQLLDTIEDQDKKLHAYLVEDYRVRDEEFIESLSQGIWALLGETEKEASMTEPGPMKCAQCHESPGFIAWWSCPKCGDYCCGDKCAIAHAENCQKPPPPRAGICHACQRTFTLEEDFVHQHGKYWCLQCHRHSEREPPKIGGNYGALDVRSWFQLREPTQEQADKMDALRVIYTNLALDIEKVCSEGADRMAALRLLKQSMHTAIGSIVTADAWQTPKGD